MDSIIFTLSMVFYTVVISLFTWYMAKYNRVALFFFVTVGILFPMLANTSDWDSWFDYAKRYSILAITLGIAVVNTLVLYRAPAQLANNKLYKLVSTFISIMIILNVIEVAVAELTANNIVNGILVALLGLTAFFRLHFNKTNQVIGFDDVWWIVAFSSCLGYTYIFNPVMQNICFSAEVIVVMALVGIALKRDVMYWLTFRCYALMFASIVDSFFPYTSEYLYPPFLEVQNRLLLKCTWVEMVFLGINVLLVGYMLLDRMRKKNFIYRSS